MGTTGHLLLASDSDIESLIRDPGQLYAITPEEKDLGFRLPANRFRELADLNTMSWLLSGEYPGVSGPGPVRPIAFLARGGTPTRIDARIWISGPVLSVPEVRLFPLGVLREIAAAVDQVDEGAIARKGGEASVAHFRDLKEFLRSGAEKELLLLIWGSRCFLLSEPELRTVTASALSPRPRRAPSPHRWLDQESTPERHLGLDKLWDAMCRLLEASDPSANGSWALFEQSGVPIGGQQSQGFGYGPARAYHSREVAKLSERLSHISESAIVANLRAADGSYRVAQRSPDEYIDLLRQSKTLLERGAARRSGLIAYLV